MGTCGQTGILRRRIDGEGQDGKGGSSPPCPFRVPYTIYIIIKKKRSEKIYGKEEFDERNREVV